MDSSDDDPAAAASSSGGEDGGGGTRVGGGRRRARPGRDDAWLGSAWGDGDASDGGGSARRRRKRGRRGDDEDDGDSDGDLPLRPVGFVPGGVTGGLSGEEAGEPHAPPRGGLGSSRAARPMVDDDDDADRAPGLGARPGLGGGGLGFRGGDDVDNHPAPPPGLGGGGGGGGGLGWAPPDTAAAADDDDDGVPALPGEFGKRVMEGARRRRDAEAAARAAAAGGSTTTAPPSSRPATAADIGTFEKHTRGIGAKLLSKMGYTPGAGLGRAGQGIARPVEAVQRSGRAGMGFGPRGEPKPKAAAGPAPPPPSKAKEKAPPAPRLWRAKDAAARERRATTFITPSEAVAAAAADGGSGAPPPPLLSTVGPILDLTGPRARVRSGPSAGAPGEDDDAADADASLPLPELQHNLRLLVDLAGSEAASFDARARAARDRAALLERERDRAGKVVAIAAADADRLARLVAGAEAAVKAAASALAAASPHPTPPALYSANAAAAAAFASLKDAHPSHYAACGLPAIASAAALPLLAALLGPGSAWAPLDEPDPAPAVAAALRWRPVTEAAGHTHRPPPSGRPPPDCGYARLLRATALPALAAALVRGWEPRHPGPALSLVEAWAPALPGPPDVAALHSTVLLPRLASALAAWDPTTDPVPVHAWLHPWLPVLGEASMRPLWPPLRHKLGAALGDWHPSDGSAAALLRPWKPVFERRDWDALMRRAIAPKLAWAVGEGGPLDLHPGVDGEATALAAWHWAAAWESLLGPASLAALLATHFFPRWRAVLATWLGAPGCDADEVTAWHAAWAARMPPGLADQPPVRAALAAGLDAIHRGGFEPEAALASPAPAAPTRVEADDGGRAGAEGVEEDEEAGGLPHSLRDQVEAAALAAGLPPLLPAPGGRRHDGRPVLLCGRVPLVLDAAKGVMLMQRGAGGGGGGWVPASLEDVAAEHARRGG